MRLQGKRAIITGGGTGIGKAIALRFAAEGAKVLITSRRQEVLEKVGAQSENILPFASDLTTNEGPQQVVQEAVRLMGGIDILVNNSGAFEPIPFEHSGDSVFDQQFDINVRAMYRLTRSALPELKKNPGANVVNIGSILSFVGMPMVSAYCASKGAVLNLSRALAVELGPLGIRVNCVCPALVRTDLTEEMIESPGFKEKALMDYPLGRFGETMNIAHAVLFLASDEASWITGVCLPVDGGYTAK